MKKKIKELIEEYKKELRIQEKIDCFSDYQDGMSDGECKVLRKIIEDLENLLKEKNNVRKIKGI
jgi:hypothetical protein